VICSKGLLNPVTKLSHRLLVSLLLCAVFICSNVYSCNVWIVEMHRPLGHTVLVVIGLGLGLGQAPQGVHQEYCLEIRSELCRFGSDAPSSLNLIDSQTSSLQAIARI
jgi:hypothetical protein